MNNEIGLPGYTAELVFSDEFDGPKLNPEHFRIEDMMHKDCLHRTGNEGIDRNGKPGSFVLGKRHAAWYDEYHDELIRLRDSHLELGIKAVKKHDPTRRGPYGDNRLYASWVDTCAFHYVEGKGQTPMPLPNKLFTYGTWFRFKVNFEQVRTPGARVSIWFSSENKGDNPDRDYDADPSNGVESDVLEYDYAQPHTLMMKVVGGKAGDTPGGEINLLKKFGIDISVGDHIVDYIWLEDRLIWRVDGVQIQEDKDRVPLNRALLIFSRELNSGVKAAWDLREGDVLENPPYLPADPGLFGVSVLDHIYKRDRDVARFDYVHAYKLTKVKGTAKGNNKKSLRDRLNDLLRRRLDRLLRKRRK